ncbi:LysM domain-containing protein [Pseudorhodoferax sp.]|uniref:LysM domain-containing protein n=1 Tax=Pseudorhodoferax sp. TaxID=1993553 RepID=UPI0039E3F1F6
MADALQSFLQANGLAPASFPPDSRYHGLPTAQARLPGGRTVVFVTRRLLPPPENFALLQTVAVAAGERADQLAARHLGAAAQWWRLADANGAMHPEAMVAEPGTRLRITLPEGVPAPAGD